MRYIFALLIAIGALATVEVTSGAEQTTVQVTSPTIAPDRVDAVPTTTTTTTTTAPPTTTTTLPPITFAPKCPDTVRVAQEVGWPTELLKKLDAVAYRESRCDPEEDSHNPGDPAGGSFGVMQVNCSWVKPNRWYPEGYLSRIGVTDCNQLFDTQTNLRASLELCWYSINRHGHCWHPWKV